MARGALRRRAARGGHRLLCCICRSLQKSVGLTTFTVFGNTFSALVQFVLVWTLPGAPGTLVPYVVIWWLGQLFGFSSSMASSILLSTIVPKESRGSWMGISAARRICREGQLPCNPRLPISNEPRTWACEGAALPGAREE